MCLKYNLPRGGTLGGARRCGVAEGEETEPLRPKKGQKMLFPLARIHALIGMRLLLWLLTSRTSQSSLTYLISIR